MILKINMERKLKNNTIICISSEKEDAFKTVTSYFIRKGAL